MKALLVILILHAGFLPLAIAGGPAAKAALRTLARERGSSWLNRIVHISGDKGMDQPAAWHIVATNDKGGLQEFFVGPKGIISEGPVPESAAASLNGPTISQKRWTLDSTNAFTKAEAVAKKAGIGYDSADFRLSSPKASSAPVWSLELNNPAGQKVADVVVSAESGKVLSFVAFNPAPPPPPAPAQSNTQQALTRTKDAINRSTASLGRGLNKAGGWIRRKFSPEPAPVPYYEPTPAPSGVTR